jgi:hypothetical protein
MKKNRILNILLAVFAAVTVTAGILAAGSIRGWFDSPAAENNTVAVLSPGRGIVTIERNGASYTVNSDTPLRAGDIITTPAASSAGITGKFGNIDLNEKTSVIINDADNFSAELTAGEIFSDIDSSGSFQELIFSGNTLSTDAGTFSVDVQSGSCSAAVLRGSVKITGNRDNTLSAGQRIRFTDGSQATEALDINSLDSFACEESEKVLENKELCFTSEQFTYLNSSRAAENLLTDKNTSSETAQASETSDSSSAKMTDGSKAAQSYESEDNQEAVLPSEKEEISQQENYTSSETGDADSAKKCSIQVRCDTILNNMSELSEGKSSYVPSDGIILTMTGIEFQDGDSAFSILQKACDTYGIALEYSWTPLYNSYYVEGINNLYEFDCGSESGWEYKVNGWFPNYGCSSYTVNDGDMITFCYTCHGFGADVGGSN